MKTLNFVLKGRVQGIGFRKTIKKFAERNNLKGFVKNNEEGSVKGVLQGSEIDLSKFIRWIEKNPSFSYISVFDKKFANKNLKLNDFKIIKDDSFFVDKIKAVKNLIKHSFEKEKTIPTHVVIIPDGNRRWAKRRGLDPIQGHIKAGSYKNLFSLFNEAKKKGVKYISFWGFSTENWKRSKKEVDNLFGLFLKEIGNFRKEAHKNKLRFRHIGRKDRLPKKLIQEIEKLEKETEKYDEFNIQFCLDYGGRDEIIRAINRLLKDKKKITEENFKEYLDTKDIPDPDLIIRTSGEQRLSGFMPYQTVYSELYFTKKDFPDFDKKELSKAIESFNKRKRRFGGN